MNESGLSRMIDEKMINSFRSEDFFSCLKKLPWLEVKILVLY